MLRELQTQLANADLDWILPVPNTETITLHHILASARGSNNGVGDVKQKLDLSSVLTRGLYHFYKTAMMPRPWTEDTIEFLFERRQVNGVWITAIFPDRPMISALADSDPPEDDISAQTSRLAALEGPIPEIKALGVILLQIWLHMPMAQLSRQCPKFFENGNVTRTGQLNLCHSLDTGILGHLPAELRPLCRIIERCFDDEVFKQHPSDEIYVTGVGLAIYDQIFEPIEELAEQLSLHIGVLPCPFRPGDEDSN